MQNTSAVMLGDLKYIPVKGINAKNAKPKEMESDWGDEKPELESQGWTMIVGVITIILLGIGVAVFMGGGKKTYVGNRAMKQYAVASEEIIDTTFNPAIAEEWQGPLPAKLAESFTKAKTQEERLKLVRDPERVAAMMSAFFDSGAGAKEKILNINPMGPGSNGSLTFLRFRAKLDNEGSRLLAVVLTDDGAKVDFECYARHGSASWSDLLSGKATQATEMRGFLTKEFLFTNQFSDEKQWNCFLITTPDCEELIYGYAVRGSETDKALLELGTAGDIRVTLALRAVGDSFQKRQFEVTQLVAPTWVH